MSEPAATAPTMGPTPGPIAGPLTSPLTSPLSPPPPDRLPALPRSVSAPPRRVALLRLALVFACMLLAALAAYQFSARAGLAALRNDALHDLDLLATAIDGATTRYAHVPSAVGLNADVLGLLRAPGSERPRRQPAANRYLEQLNDYLGGLAIFVIDLKGRVVASSDWIYTDNLLGQDQSRRPYFRAAAQGAPDRYYAVDSTRNEAGYFFAHPIRDERQDWKVIGVAVIKVGLAELERRWMPNDIPALIADPNGVVIVASVPDWRYAALQPLSGEVAAEIEGSRQFADHALHAFPIALDLSAAAAGTLATFPKAVTTPANRKTHGRDFLVAERHLAGTGWQLVTFSDLRGLRASAATHAALAAAASGCVLLLVLYLLQRRRALKVRLEAQGLLEQANAELEHKVAERTADLTAANDRLRAEVAERLRAEQTLRAAQDELVQAAKMAALGQLAAGITHELAQPLGAMRTLSGNAVAFMERGDLPTASKNLAIIANLVDRMGAIIGPLKTFARKSPGHPQAVDVAQALGNALFLLDQRLRRDDITVHNECTPGQATTWHAWCDQIRLEQVLINLISNAADAMQAMPAVQGNSRRELHLAARRGAPGRLEIRVADSGPGIAAETASHLFEPFFTTKAVGEGLGLGLAISREIIRGFGGELRAENRPEGGAEFTIDLPEAAESPS